MFPFMLLVWVCSVIQQKFQNFSGPNELKNCCSEKNWREEFELSGVELDEVMKKSEVYVFFIKRGDEQIQEIFVHFIVRIRVFFVNNVFHISPIHNFGKSQNLTECCQVTGKKNEEFKMLQEPCNQNGSSMYDPANLLAICLQYFELFDLWGKKLLLKL